MSVYTDDKDTYTHTRARPSRSIYFTLVNLVYTHGNWCPDKEKEIFQGSDITVNGLFFSFFLACGLREEREKKRKQRPILDFLQMTLNYAEKCRRRSDTR